MKILCLILFFTCSIYQQAVAIGNMDATTVARIAQGLKHDSEGLQLFLNSVLHSPSSIVEDQSDGYAESSILKTINPVELAIQPISTADQINLEAEQINFESSEFQKALTKPYFVHRVDLSAIETDEQLKLAMDYFIQHNLCNLRILILPDNVNFCKEFVAQIFPVESDHRYVSLLRVIVNSGIGECALHEAMCQIERHFGTYTTVVRDMPQKSGKYDCIAAFLTIECEITTQGWMQQEGWFFGKKLSDTITIHYRVDKPSAPNMSFIMGLRT